VAVPDSKIQRAYRVRISLFLLAICIAGAVLVVGSQATQTLRVLEIVERDRDRWQQADRVLERLNLKSGSVVADVGCGAGYFSLKLAPIVGEKGGVFAEDIITEPLVFLWLRARLHGLTNVHVIHGTAQDPHLSVAQVDAVLVANSYHEFAHPRPVLDQIFKALRPAGRLVMIDRGPLPGEDESREFETQHHERALSAAETELLETGFKLISRDEHFIDRPAFERPRDGPDDRPWWLIVAQKP
jgi:SAM-dependent methyltransferase